MSQQGPNPLAYLPLASTSIFKYIKDQRSHQPQLPDHRAIRVALPLMREQGLRVRQQGEGLAQLPSMLPARVLKAGKYFISCFF